MKEVFNVMKRLVAVGGVISFVAGASGQTLTVLKTFNPHINDAGQHSEGTLALGPDGTLYGVTTDGGAGAAGVVFRVQTNGTAFSVIKNFPFVDVANGTNTDGATPEAGLVLSDGTLYGTTSAGGSGGSGTVFSLSTNGSHFTVLKSFSALNANTNRDGAYPMAALIVSNGVLYGTTAYGGAVGQGTVFRINTNGTAFANIHDFTNSDGLGPSGRLLLSGNTLYGTAQYGGDGAYGTVFSLNTDGTAFTLLHSFSGFGTDGAGPMAGLVLSGGQLFGTTDRGDSGDGADDGTIFRVDINGNNFTNLYSFTYDVGFGLDTELTISGSTLYGTTGNGAGGSPFGAIFKINTDGSGYESVVNFDYFHGWGPNGGMVLSGGVLYGVTGLGGAGNSGLGNGVVYSVHTDGTSLTAPVVFGEFTGAADPATGLTLSGNVLFGTTENGGTARQGTLFKIGTNGSGYAQVHEFTFPDNHGVNPDGTDPRGALVLSGGVLYGSTRYGGTNGGGTIFKMESDGTGFTNLSSRTGAIVPLVSSGTTLYGTTPQSGAYGFGSVFKINTDGTGFTNFYTFNGTDGKYPISGLTLSGNVLYGTTPNGGAGSGNIFQMNTDGTHFTNIYSFTGGGDGANPGGVLVLNNGVFYGSTVRGGTNAQGTVFKINTDRTGFAVLHTFTGADGTVAGDLLLSGNTLYGTAAAGGSFNAGCIFKLDTSGNNFAVLNNFTGGADGAQPTATLVLQNGTLYGTTESGGVSGHGTVFSLTLSSAITPIPLNISLAGSHAAVLTWINPAFALQAAPLVTGTYTNVPGASSPYTNVITGPMQFFRLQAN